MLGDCLLAALKLLLLLLLGAEHGMSSQHELTASHRQLMANSSVDSRRQFLFVFGGEGSGHHGFCDAFWLLKFAKAATTKSTVVEEFGWDLSFYFAGHEECSGHANCWRGRWVSDRNEQDPARPGHLLKINASLIRKQWQTDSSHLSRSKEVVWISCHHAMPGAHEMNGNDKFRHDDGRHWFLDQPAVAGNLTLLKVTKHGTGNAIGTFRGAFESILDNVDRLYPYDARAIYPALGAASLLPSVDPRVLLILRDLPKQVLSHTKFDNGACRHLLVTAAMSHGYIGRFAAGLRERSSSHSSATSFGVDPYWRVLWYDAMNPALPSGLDGVSIAMQNLSAWLGWRCIGSRGNVSAIEDGSCDNDNSKDLDNVRSLWHASTRSVDGKDVKLYKWMTRFQNSLAREGYLDALIDEVAEKHDICPRCAEVQKRLIDIRNEDNALYDNKSFGAGFAEICHPESWYLKTPSPRPPLKKVASSAPPPPRPARQRPAPKNKVEPIEPPGEPPPENLLTLNPDVIPTVDDLLRHLGLGESTDLDEITAAVASFPLRFTVDVSNPDILRRTAAKSNVSLTKTCV